jgi:hypothetical protein
VHSSHSFGESQWEPSLADSCWLSCLRVQVHLRTLSWCRRRCRKKFSDPLLASKNKVISKEKIIGYYNLYATLCNQHEEIINAEHSEQLWEKGRNVGSNMLCPFVFGAGNFHDWGIAELKCSEGMFVCVIWRYLKHKSWVASSALAARFLFSNTIFNLLYTWEDPQPDWRANRASIPDSLLLKTQEQRDEASWSIPGQCGCFPWSNKLTKCEIHRIGLEIWNLTT